MLLYKDQTPELGSGKGLAGTTCHVCSIKSHASQQRRAKCRFMHVSWVMSGAAGQESAIGCALGGQCCHKLAVCIAAAVAAQPLLPSTPQASPALQGSI